MPREVSTEFKTSFGRMLVGMRMNYTSANALNYSQTLIQYTYSGLVTEDKIGRYSKYDRAADYEKDFQIAEKLYKQAVEHLKLRGRNSYAESVIFSLCFDIDKRIFPIALSEGILVMTEEMFGVMDMFQGDQDPRRRGR